MKPRPSSISQNRARQWWKHRGRNSTPESMDTTSPKHVNTDRENIVSLDVQHPQRHREKQAVILNAAKRESKVKWKRHSEKLRMCETETQTANSESEGSKSTREQIAVDFLCWWEQSLTAKQKRFSQKETNSRGVCSLNPSLNSICSPTGSYIWSDIVLSL